MKVYVTRPHPARRKAQFSAKTLCNSFVVAAALSACSTPAVKTVTKEVLVPVATHPLKPEQVPTPVGPLPKRPDSLSAAADILLSWHCRMVAYMYRADPLLRISAGLPARDLPAYPECDR